MFGEDYAYAVARIRVLETGLLNEAAIEQVLACQDEQQGVQILTEKGWGNGDPAAGAGPGYRGPAGDRRGHPVCGPLEDRRRHHHRTGRRVYGGSVGV